MSTISRQPEPPTGAAARQNWFTGAVAYPQQYVWFVFFAALDIMITWIVLHSGGLELNWLAAIVIERYGAAGTTAYKFGIVTVVIIVCETLARLRPETGYKVAEWAVAISVIPVAVGIVQLLVDLRYWILPTFIG